MHYVTTVIVILFFKSTNRSAFMQCSDLDRTLHTQLHLFKSKTKMMDFGSM